MTKAVETRGLRVVYRRGLLRKPRVALEGLDLIVEEGEIFGYLGPNGAGKTSTLKCLTGLIRSESGKASLFGVDVGEVRSRKEIGFLPEGPYFYEYLTALELLDFAGRLSGLGRAERARRSQELLERVGLERSAQTRLKEFSRGMRQRIGLAQAFIHRPRLVILDEPMSGLDPVGRRDVREFIREMRAGGTTVFFSSHILADVEAICDTVGILHEGRLVSRGRLSEILSPRVVSRRVSARGIEESDIEQLAASDCHRDGSLLSFSVPGDVDPSSLVEIVHSKGGELVSLEPEKEDLEGLFMRITGRNGGDVQDREEEQEDGVYETAGNGGENTDD